MELELREIKVNLSDDQKQEIRNAFINSEDIRLLLKKDALRGSDTLIVPLQIDEELDDIPDGTYAVIDESTFNEIWEEFIPQNPTFFSDDIWGYFGLPFPVAIDSSFKSKGIDFSLNYSLVNDSAKDNIKNLFQ